MVWGNWRQPFLLVLVCVLALVGGRFHHKTSSQDRSLRETSRNMYTQESFRSPGPTVSPPPAGKVAPSRKRKVQEKRKGLQSRSRHGRVLSDDGYNDDYQAIPMNYTLDINCGSIIGTACTSYIQKYLNEYINVNQSYNRLNLPVFYPHNIEEPPTEPSVLTPPDSSSIGNLYYETVECDLMITLNDLLDVDIVTGTMTISMFIDYIWVDELLSWNSSNTANNEEILIPMNWVWEPDILLYNSVAGEAMSWDTGQIYMYNDGTIWYSATANVVISCSFDLNMFPFDTQTCSPLFSSWSFADYELNISSVEVEVNNKSFNNLAWNVDSVVASREVITQWEIYNFSFGIVYITISRYSQHYVNTVIVPALLVTCIVISALWLRDVNNRLSLAITGLLTIIAIQWSVSAKLPISQYSNWLSGFLFMSTVYVIVICLECYIAGYMYALAEKYPNNTAPCWVRWIINVSIMTKFREESKAKKENSPHMNEWAGAGTNPMVEGVELSDINTTEKTANNNSACTSHEVQSSSETAPQAGSAESGTNVLKYGWRRGGHAFDRLMKVLIPLSYLLCCIILFSVV